MGVTSGEDEARSRTQEWAAGVVNKLTSTTNGGVLEAEEADGDLVGRITTSRNGIATRL